MATISLITSIAVKIAAKKGQEIIEKIFKGDRNAFEQKLWQVINDTMTQFKKSHPNNSDNKGIQFYESETVVEELLNYSLFEDITPDSLEAAIKTDSRILSSEIETIKEFLYLFQSNLSKIPELRKLEIEFNFKERVAKTFELLTQLTSTFNKTIQEIDNSLKGEFHIQLNEIKEDIENFKSATALVRLEKLEARILDKNKNDDITQGKIYYLKGLCYEDLEVFAKSDFFIKAYNYNSSNFSYKEKACTQYLNNGDSVKALSLADEIISKDDYNITGWLVKTVTSGVPLSKSILIPPEIVKNNRYFKLSVYNWYSFKKDIPSLVFLKKKGFISEEVLIIDLPEKITFEDKNQWYRLAVINLNCYSEANPVVSIFIDKHAKQDPKIHYLRRLCELSKNAFENSEVKVKYAPFIFYYYYFDFLCSQSINSIDKTIASYNNIKEPFFKNLVSFAQILITDKREDLALEYMNNYNELNENDKGIIHLLKCGIYRVKNKIDYLKSSLKEYILSNDCIDESVLHNILINIHGIFNNSEELNLFFGSIYEKVNFKEEILKLFLDTYIRGSFYRDISKDDFKNLMYTFENNELLNTPFLKQFISSLYYTVGDWESARNHLNTYIHKESSNSGLFLYINCLIEDERSDKVELLKLLKWWRNNVTIERKFLNAEMNYRQYTQDWEEIESISDTGIKYIPEEEQFIALNLISLSKQNKIEKIKLLLEYVLEQKFSYEINAINTAIILLQNDFPRESLQVLYNSAKKRENKRARQQYMSTTIHYPEKFFEELSIITTGCFVKYSLDGKTYITEINLDKENNEISDALMNYPEAELRGICALVYSNNLN
jgi:hypothetical protein